MHFHRIPEHLIRVGGTREAITIIISLIVSIISIIISNISIIVSNISIIVSIKSIIIHGSAPLRKQEILGMPTMY